MGLCPTMEPSTPFVQRPSFACRINQLPARKNWPWDNKGYVLTVTLELEFPDREPLWTQQGFCLTDYELGPFLETVDQVRNSNE